MTRHFYQVPLWLLTLLDTLLGTVVRFLKWLAALLVTATSVPFY